MEKYTEMKHQQDARLIDNFSENLFCRGFYSRDEMEMVVGTAVGVVEMMSCNQKG
jgi:putative methionine-R-sulfoxide reductase with GAF domain